MLKAVTLPERTLGPELARRLTATKVDHWYPISLTLEALDVLADKLGTYGLHHVGWELFKLTAAEDVRAHVRSARDLVHGIDRMYKQVNRGEGIGGWKVLQFAPGYAQLEKTTPHHCLVEEGILEEALRTIGIRVEITQSQCVRKGDDACHFELKSPVTDARWTG